MSRLFAPDGLPVSLANVSWLTPTRRVSAITMQGLVWDGSLIPAPRADARAFAYAVVEGQLHLPEATLGEGEVALFPSFTAIHRAGAVATGARAGKGTHRAVALRFDSPHLVDRVGRTCVDLQALSALHGKLACCHPDPRPELALVTRALELHDEVEANDSQSAVAVAKALSRVLSPTHGLPGLVDLDLPRSSRHSRRMVDDFLRLYHLPFEHFRELRTSFTTTTAIVLLSRPELSLDKVAKAVGLASATSLCHMLERTETPAPNVLRARYVELSHDLCRTPASTP